MSKTSLYLNETISTEEQGTQSRLITSHRPICLASLRDRATNQVLAEKACKAERSIKSPSSKPVKREDRPSLRRASLRDGVADQVPTEQACETERPTKSPPSNLMGSPNLVLLNHVAITGRTITKTRLDMRVTYRRGTRGRHQHNWMPSRAVFGVSPLPCGVSQPQSYEDLNIRVSTVTHIPGNTRHAPYRMYAYAPRVVMRGS